MFRKGFSLQYLIRAYLIELLSLNCSIGNCAITLAPDNYHNQYVIKLIT